MAGAQRTAAMSRARAILISVDGLNSAAVKTSAREALANVCSFAPRPGVCGYGAAGPRAVWPRQGLVEFCWERGVGIPAAVPRRRLLDRPRVQPRAAARRRRARQA